MLGIWSIAKHTFAQCMRMKLAAAFAVLLTAALLALPAQMTGDGTLAGQIRAFLSYGTGISLGLLSIMTIFVGASLVSNDIRTRQIFTVAVKPLARWQYVLGRWLGLVLFDAVLLALACVAIYAAAAHMRTKDTTGLGAVSLLDRRIVETEVFAARRQIKPKPIDMDTELAKRIVTLQESGRYESAIAGWMDRAGLDRTQAELRLVDQLRLQIGAKLQSIAPTKRMWWRFSDVQVAGREIRMEASVLAPLDDSGVVRFITPESFACRLWRNGPIMVNGFDARVAIIDRRAIAVGFPEKGVARERMSTLAAGDTAELVVDPILQISYILTPSDPNALPEGKVRAWWRAHDGENPGVQWSRLPDVTKQKTSISISSRLVGKKAKLQFGILNDSPTSLEVLMRDVSLLYNVGTFENNFLRASLLMLCQLAYLAAVAVLAGSIVSFPVACLMCFVLGPFSLARAFLVNAVSIDIGGDVDIITWLAHHIFKPFYVLLPDFARTMPGDRLIDGMDISWAFVGQTALADVVIRAGAAMLLACLIFRRRELARVQV
jgi:hypothetical protein